MRTVALLALSIVASSGAAAQSVSEFDQRIARLDSLIGVRLSELPSMRERERDSARSVAFQVQGFRLRVPREYEGIVRRGAEAAWPIVVAHGGTWAQREMPRGEIEFLPTIGRTRLGVLGERLSVEDGAAAAEVRPMDVIGVQQALIYIVDIRIGLSIQAAFAGQADAPPAWQHPSFAPLERRNETVSWENLALRLRLHPARTNRECIAGDGIACLASLGVTIPPDVPPSVRHDPEDYPWLAAGMPRPRTAEQQVRRSQCVADGDATECEAFLHATGLPFAFDPTNDVARASFIWTALEMGGPGALDRLLASQGSVAQRLEAAAGTPLAAVAARWQQRVAVIEHTSPGLPLVLCGLAAMLLVSTPSRRTLR